MRMLIPIVLLLIGLGGGIGAGMMMSGRESDAETADAENNGQDGEGADGAENEEGTGDDYENDEGYEEEDAGPPPRVEASGENTEYVRLNNQFVVPVVREGAVRSLVVMGLTLEVQTGQSSTVFSQEPRLRDSFLRVLFAHANAGGFDGTFTESSAMAPLREALLEAAVRVLGEANIFDVLITDITRQDA